MPDDPLVTTEWLAERLGDPELRVVDCRGYVSTRQVEPGVEEATYLGALQEYLAGHIPDAVYVDWTADIIDPDDPVPVQVAPPTRFAEAMGSRGIGDGTKVVAVDHMGGQFATRLWWALTYYGHDAAYVLDGGLNRWIDEDRPIEPGPVTVAPGVFTPRARPEWRATADQVRAMIGDDRIQLLDARDAAQFTGAKRRGPRGGHIPGARSLPRESFFAEGGSLRPSEEIRRLATERGLSPNLPVVAYCNGGVAATVALFQLHRAGFPSLANYDGSWNEWGARSDLPTESS